MRTLNSLQTNASYLEEVKRQRGDLQTQLETMKLYLARSGLQVKGAGPGTTPTVLGESCGSVQDLVFLFQVEDLDQLNIIHVTGTKGKVRDGALGEGERASCGRGGCPVKSFPFQGSTCAFTERILRSCGLKTGFFRYRGVEGCGVSGSLRGCRTSQHLK